MSALALSFTGTPAVGLIYLVEFRLVPAPGGRDT